MTLEPVSYGGDTYYNVVGTKPGVINPGQEYIIGAHYDSVNNPGADDNASGVALVLESARVLTQYPSEYTIRFIAFDREEQGLHGSEQYVLDHIDDDIQGMISADMVAYNTGADHVDIYGRTASNPIKNALAEAVDTYGDGLTRALYFGIDASDHAPFEWYGFQACLIIEDWGNPYYHTQQDNVDMPNYIDYPYATQITRVIVGFLVDNAGVIVDTPDGDFDDDDDVDMDDYAQFELCFTGPDGGPLAPECLPGDFDVDGDIDCDDWAQFVLAWTEPGDPPELSDCIVVDPLPAPAPHDAPKNRYLSFDTNHGDNSIAYQVEMTACDYFPHSTGVLGWVGPPYDPGCQDDQGDPLPDDPPCWGEYASRLVDEPFYSDAWPALLHVGDCEIVPVAGYEIRATGNGEYFSDPLAIGTIAQPTPPPPKWWADIVGMRVSGAWSPPDAFVNFYDIQAAVLVFESPSDGPHWTWADVEDATPNAVINLTDVQMIILAFEGAPYPFDDPKFCP